jgi:hypothetical protein
VERVDSIYHGSHDIFKVRALIAQEEVAKIVSILA